MIESAAVGFQIAAGGTDINVCAGGVNCTAQLPKVQILNPAVGENPFGILDDGTLYVSCPELLDFEINEKKSFKVNIAVIYGLEVARAADQFVEFTVDVRIYSVSHKVEISERFKSHRIEFKGQSSTLKHAEKIDE